MMVSQLDTTHYNQVAGKTMTAYFFNNQIYRNDVNGNAQTIYYMQDGEPVEITMMGVIESGEISFFIEDKQVVQITYRGDPVYNFYPMDKIPPTQDIRLKGFKWEGARRPSQAEVFDRRIRPSERERRSEMKHPDFPIMQRIDEHSAAGPTATIRSMPRRSSGCTPSATKWTSRARRRRPRNSGAEPVRFCRIVRLVAVLPDRLARSFSRGV